MATVANLAVSVTASTTKFHRAMRGVNKTIGGVAKSIGGLKAGVAGLAVGVGVGGLASFTSGVLDAADEIQKLGIRTGASARFLSEMRHVAKLSGVEFSTFTKGLERMQRGIGDAASKGGEAADAIEQLGLDVNALVGMKPADQFRLIGDALRQVGDNSLRLSLATAIGGRSFSELLQITQQGSGAIAELREQSRKLGQSFSEEQVAAAAKANDAIATLTASFRGLGEALVIELAGPIAGLADTITTHLIPAFGEIKKIARGDFLDIDTGTIGQLLKLQPGTAGLSLFLDMLGRIADPSVHAGPSLNVMSGEFRMGQRVDQAAEETRKSNDLLRSIRDAIGDIAPVAQ